MASNLQRAVVLHGGIGNQLFQWAYGHQLATKGFRVNFVFFNKPYKLAHTRESLQKYIRDCEHGTFSTLNLSSNRLIRTVQDPTDPYNPFSLLKNKLAKNLEDPFTIPNQNDSFAYHLGYYQNSSIVDKLKDILVPELLVSLDSGKKSSTTNDLVGAEVIHIRRGDTLTPQNMERVGVLSSEYYSKLPRKSAHRRIVVTDDIEGAKIILREQDIDTFYGPDDLSVKETLRVMANASSLYTANSSLSWWGGVLAQYQGAKVFIPDPYFRNFTPNPGNALSFPGFQKLPSDFIAPLK